MKFREKSFFVKLLRAEKILSLFTIFCTSENRLLSALSLPVVFTDTQTNKQTKTNYIFVPSFEIFRYTIGNLNEI